MEVRLLERKDPVPLMFLSMGSQCESGDGVRPCKVSVNARNLPVRYPPCWSQVDWTQHFDTF